MTRTRQLYSETYDLNRLYNYIVSYKKSNNGNSPSFRDIRSYMEISTTSMIPHLLDKLVDMGLITYKRGVSRSINVLSGRWINN